MLGRKISDPEISEVESKFTHVKLVDANGTVGAQVSKLFRFRFSSRELAPACSGWKCRGTDCLSEYAYLASCSVALRIDIHDVIVYEIAC